MRPESVSCRWRVRPTTRKSAGQSTRCPSPSSLPSEYFSSLLYPQSFCSSLLVDSQLSFFSPAPSLSPSVLPRSPISRPSLPSPTLPSPPLPSLPSPSPPPPCQTPAPPLPATGAAGFRLSPVPPRGPGEAQGPLGGRGSPLGAAAGGPGRKQEPQR